MTTNTIYTASVTAPSANKPSFFSKLMSELSCWTVTRADIMRMSRENAEAYKADHAE